MAPPCPAQGCKGVREDNSCSECMRRHWAATYARTEAARSLRRYLLALSGTRSMPPYTGQLIPVLPPNRLGTAASQSRMQAASLTANGSSTASALSGITGQQALSQEAQVPRSTASALSGVTGRYALPQGAQAARSTASAFSGGTGQQAMSQGAQALRPTADTFSGIAGSRSSQAVAQGLQSLTTASSGLTNMTPPQTAAGGVYRSALGGRDHASRGALLEYPVPPSHSYGSGYESGPSSRPTGYQPDVLRQTLGYISATPTVGHAWDQRPTSPYGDTRGYRERPKSPVTESSSDDMNDSFDEDDSVVNESEFLPRSTQTVITPRLANEVVSSQEEPKPEEGLMPSVSGATQQSASLDQIETLHEALRSKPHPWELRKQQAIGSGMPGRETPAARSAPGNRPRRPTLSARQRGHGSDGGAAMHDRISRNRAADRLPLPPGWVQYVDVEGRVYYHNQETGMVTWDCPASQVVTSRQANPAMERGYTPHTLDRTSARQRRKKAKKLRAQDGSSFFRR